MSKPKVSIVSISYNQDKYIRQALDSMIEQDTRFEYEIIIADDASTDDTQMIIREYGEKYPHILKHILRDKNVGVQSNLVDALKHAKGDYVALCEGDDFWTDKHKLQRQVDFLDRNDDYSLCFHPVSVIFDDKEQPDAIFPVEKDGFTLEKLLKSNYIQTNSVMYRRREYDAVPLNILPLDWYLHLFHAQFGKIGFINQDMSSYRRHAGGMWWGSQAPDILFWEKYAQLHINLFEEVKKLFADRPENIRSIIVHSESALLLSIIDTCLQARNGAKFIENLMISNPAAFITLSLTLQKELEKALKLVQTNNDIAQQARKEVECQLKQLDDQLKQLESQLKDIKNSRSYKLSKRVSSFKSKFIKH